MAAPAVHEACRSAPTDRRCVEIRPRTGWCSLDLAGLWAYRELLYFLIWRELRVRYKQAAIGVGWAVIQPVLTVAIFVVVFGHFAKLPSDGVPYALFAFAAVLPWSYFAEAVRRSSTGPVNDAELVRKVYFPRLLIPLAMVLAPLFDFAAAFVVFLGLLAWYGVTPSAYILLLPVLVLLEAAVALAVGLVLGPLNVRFRDVAYVLPFVLQLWLYASPVVYGLSLVPAEWRTLYSLNPMVGVIEGFRFVMIGKGTPDATALALSGSFAILGLVGGLFFFSRTQRAFADVI